MGKNQSIPCDSYKWSYLFNTLQYEGLEKDPWNPWKLMQNCVCPTMSILSEFKDMIQEVKDT